MFGGVTAVMTYPIFYSTANESQTEDRREDCQVRTAVPPTDRAQSKCGAMAATMFDRG